MITFEHTAPATLIWLGIVLSVLVCIFSYARFVRVNLYTLIIVLIRVIFFALLLWCLFLPEMRRSETEILKPRFIVGLDTSNSMTLSPAEGIPRRWDTALQALQMEWTKSVGAECEIDVYSFAADVSRKLTLQEALELVPDETATLLRDSLRKVTSRYAGQNVGGFVLLTDGIDTREADDNWAAATWPFAVYTVLLEREMAWEEEPDVRIDSVHTPRRVTVGWQTELKAVVSGEGTKGQVQNLQLFRNEAKIDEVPVQIPAGGGAREVKFKLKNPEVGSYTYRIHVPPLEGESNKEDNEYEVSVLVIDVKNRLLYVEGPPRWESKYLSRVLKANKQISSLGFIRGPGGKFMTFGVRGSMTPDMREGQLAFFKIVILGNLNAGELGPERAQNLVKFVETGGALVLLGGAEAWGPDGFIKTQLKKIMPVKSYGTRIVEGNYPVELTDDGRSHAAFASTDADLWDVIPPVLSVFPNATLSLGARALVNANTPAGPQTMIATHRYGQGKVAVTLTDSLWKWVLNEKALEHKPYQRFWNQLLAWAMPEKEEIDARRLDIWTDREQLFLGEKVEIRARKTGKEEDAGHDVPVKCEITTPDKRKIPFVMDSEHVVTPSGKPFPGFATRFEAGSPGLHYAAAVMEIDGKKIESDPLSFFVKPFTPESVPRAANFNVLRLLARNSGGKYFNNVRELSDELAALSFASIEQEKADYESLWQQWLIIGLLVALLSTEWLLRKLRNMP